MSDESEYLMSIAKAQTEALFDLKRSLVVRGEQLTKRMMRDRLYTVLLSSEVTRKQPKKERKPRAAAFANLTDEEFIAHLESLPHLAGVDVRREIGKCQFHFSTLGIVPTRKRVAKWVNRADRPLGFNGAGQSSFVAKKQDGIAEPTGWKEWVRENCADPTNADKSWADLDRTAQNYIAGQMRRSAA